MHIGGGLGKRVSCTKRFGESWHKLPEALRKRARAKITLLQQKPAHPSLHVHQLHRMALQVCSISTTYRLLFSRQADRILLLDIGTHRCVDRAHIHLQEHRSSDRQPVERSSREKRTRSAHLPPPALRRKQQKQKKRWAHLPIFRRHRPRRRP